MFGISNYDLVLSGTIAPGGGSGYLAQRRCGSAIQLTVSLCTLLLSDAVPDFTYKFDIEIEF